MATTRFNEPLRRLIRPALTLLSAALFGAGVAAATPSAAAETPKAPASITASEGQAIAHIRGSWWLARGIHDNLWSDFDPNSIPLLLVERRPGRAPWALLAGVAAPPPGFTLVSPAGIDRPAIYGAKEASLKAGARSPVLFAGKSTAVYFEGETLPEGAYGMPATEQVLPQIIHEMAHVYAVSSGIPVDLVPPTAPDLATSPEVVALAILENRILSQVLYADSGRGQVLEEAGRDFLAVRRARWAMMGAASEYERRVEIFEAPAVFAQAQALKLAATKVVEPPPIQDADATYHEFQFGFLWRLNLLIGRLVESPMDTSQLAARLPISGAAQVLMMERLGVDWHAKLFKGETSLPDLLAGRIAMTPVQQETALAAAREAYGYELAIALARERVATRGAAR